MGLFSARTPNSEPDPPNGNKPQPVSRDRVELYLTSRDYKYTIDDDGDVYGMWDSHYFYFLFYGDNKEILQVRGRWRETVDLENTEEVKDFVNDWNREHYWPKTYYVDDGDMQVCAEVTTDLEQGVTDQQLGQLIDCGLFTGLQFFKEMDNRFAHDLPEEEPDTDPAD